MRQRWFNHLCASMPGQLRCSKALSTLATIVAEFGDNSATATIVASVSILSSSAASLSPLLQRICYLLLKDVEMNLQLEIYCHSFWIFLSCNSRPLALYSSLITLILHICKCVIVRWSIVHNRCELVVGATGASAQKSLLSTSEGENVISETESGSIGKTWN